MPWSWRAPGCAGSASTSASLPRSRSTALFRPWPGIVALEIRADDERTRQAVARIHDDAAGTALAAEWAVVAALGGGYQLPLGAIAVHDAVAAELELTAVVASRDGGRLLRRSDRGRAPDAAALGARGRRSRRAPGRSSC